MDLRAKYDQAIQTAKRLGFQGAATQEGDKLHFKGTVQTQEEANKALIRRYREAHRAALREAYATGITGVPAFEIGGRRLVGLQSREALERALTRITTHRWYREKFADYPEQRRILIPYLW